MAVDTTTYFVGPANLPEEQGDASAPGSVRGVRAMNSRMAGKSVPN